MLDPGSAARSMFSENELQQIPMSTVLLHSSATASVQPMSARLQAITQGALESLQL